MLNIDALTVFGLLAAAGVAAFLIRTCLRKGCSRDI